MCVPNFLFSDVYLSILFNFTIGSSLDLSFLMLSMFIIIFTIRIIKATCFSNTILMANLKGTIIQTWISSNIFLVCRRFHIKNNFCVLRYIHVRYVKEIRNFQTLRTKNSRIHRIKREKFSGYGFLDEQKHIGRFSNLH